MVVRGHASEAAGNNFAVFGHEFLQEIRILPVDRFERNVHAAAGHDSVGATKRGTAGWSLGLHINLGDALLGFPVNGPTAQEGVVFHLLKAVRCVWALFVAGRDIAGDGFAFRAGLGALKYDEVACHGGVIVRVV